MPYAASFKFRKTYQFFNFVKFQVITLLVLSEAQYFSDDENLKAVLRPLKYSNSCEAFCKNIICQPIKECSDGFILEKESYCNCCDACVQLLGIGEACIDIIEGSSRLGSQSRCKQGTICKEGRCELDITVSSCLLQRDIRQKHNETGNYASDIWIPQCDREGHYAAKQLQSTKSICMDKSGKQIFGSADDSLENTCDCSRYMEAKAKKRKALLFNEKPGEHCTSAGSFDTLQCINNLCYCADENTGEIKSELATLEFFQKLPCYDEKIHRENYLKDCERELQRSKKVANEFLKKGVQAIFFFDIDEIKCDPDGTFSPKQCDKQNCVCTDKEGKGIGQYYEDRKNTLKITMTCTCARDEISTPFMPFACETFGSYKRLTCVDGKCLCTDTEGENISNDLKESEESVCEKLIQDLSEYPKKDEDESSPDPDYDYF